MRRRLDSRAGVERQLRVAERAVDEGLRRYDGRRDARRHGRPEDGVVIDAQPSVDVHAIDARARFDKRAFIRAIACRARAADSVKPSSFSTRTPPERSSARETWKLVWPSSVPTCGARIKRRRDTSCSRNPESPWPVTVYPLAPVERHDLAEIVAVRRDAGRSGIHVADSRDPSSQTGSCSATVRKVCESALTDANVRSVVCDESSAI